MDTSAGRPFGRPRNPRTGDAIRTAALDLLAERQNLGGVSIEAIAERARVGKATIYRRWPGKEELFTDAVATLRPPLPEVGVGTARADLVALVEQVCGEMDTPFHRAISAMMVSGTHPEIVARIKRTVLAPRDEAIHATLRRGIANGEIRPDADTGGVRKLLVGGAIMGRRSEADQPPHQYAELLVDTVFRGIAAAPEGE